MSVLFFAFNLIKYITVRKLQQFTCFLFIMFITRAMTHLTPQITWRLHHRTILRWLPYWWIFNKRLLHTLVQRISNLQFHYSAHSRNIVVPELYSYWMVVPIRRVMPLHRRWLTGPVTTMITSMHARAYAYQSCLLARQVKMPVPEAVRDIKPLSKTTLFIMRLCLYRQHQERGPFDVWQTSCSVKPA